MSFIQIPKDVALLFVQAWNEKDAAKLAALFVEDAEFVNVTGLWWHDKAAIFKAHDYGFKVIFNNSTLKLIRTKVRLLADNVAIVHAKTKLVAQTALATVAKPQNRYNILVFVLKKEGDRWMCHTAQNTEIMQGKETFIIDESGKAKAVSYRKEEK
ncbi:MAG: SgcJ/EcaC family oxidoreductase [Bacteroidota bacterium]